MHHQYVYRSKTEGRNVDKIVYLAFSNPSLPSIICGLTLLMENEYKDSNHQDGGKTSNSMSWGT